jgi:hypothetical protein
MEIEMAGCVADDAGYKSERQRAEYLHYSHLTAQERFDWLASRLESAGHRDLAGYAQTWSREHRQIALNLLRQAR